MTPISFPVYIFIAGGIVLFVGGLLKFIDDGLGEKVVQLGCYCPLKSPIKFQVARAGL